MNIKQYIDSLFSSYEETDSLADFKEELESNLNARINSLRKKGLNEQAAFDKAITELGDVSTLADELSLKKRQEVFSDMYMKTRHYMSTWRIVLYVLCGAVFGFGVIVSVLSGFFSGDVNAPLGSLLIFGGIPILGFLFLGLTQETAVHEAMSWKRALLYVVAGGVFLFGVIAFLITYFEDNAGLPIAIATLIPFILPSLAFGVFLVLTEKDRSKPWVIRQRKEYMERSQKRFGDPVQQERFGLFSGALWIAAIAAFILLTILFGIKFSWLAIVVALIGQMIVLAMFTKSR
ncbi:permease prefix domain 1-containing protein [Thermoactinomyces mirandus]|uniref:Uncharacterized protein n=1 Tax=Thermoactinomyces mirandus TaxID=2756294 RepID=A0A7W2AQY8_9BACL|nr:permease prefix domain 1-containing protein [Thermoactinomyces mirandus]MBA4602003.1 hypothetical protein [Thermoactinomyces mirandus]